MLQQKALTGQYRSPGLKEHSSFALVFTVHRKSAKEFFYLPIPNWNDTVNRNIFDQPRSQDLFLGLGAGREKALGTRLIFD